MADMDRIPLKEAVRLLASINYDPTWSVEAFVNAVRHFSPLERSTIGQALHVTAAAKEAEAKALGEDVPPRANLRLVQGGGNG